MFPVTPLLIVDFLASRVWFPKGSLEKSPHNGGIMFHLLKHVTLCTPYVEEKRLGDQVKVQTVAPTPKDRTFIAYFSVSSLCYFKLVAIGSCEKPLTFLFHFDTGNRKRTLCVSAPVWSLIGPFMPILNHFDGLTWPICSMVLVYLPTKLRDFGQGQMLVRIFQQHGLHMGYDKPLADQGYSDVHKNTHLATGHSWSKLVQREWRLLGESLSAGQTHVRSPTMSDGCGTFVSTGIQHFSFGWYRGKIFWPWHIRGFSWIFSSILRTSLRFEVFKMIGVTTKMMRSNLTTSSSGSKSSFLFPFVSWWTRSAPAFLPKRPDWNTLLKPPRKCTCHLPSFCACPNARWKHDPQTYGVMMRYVKTGELLSSGSKSLALASQNAAYSTSLDHLGWWVSDVLATKLDQRHQLLDSLVDLCASQFYQSSSFGHSCIIYQIVDVPIPTPCWQIPHSTICIHMS